MSDQVTPEFSRPIDLERIGDTELRRDIEATPEERVALARRFGIPGINRLEAQVRLKRERAGTLLRLTAHMAAEVTQECVVTLAPVDSRIVEDFTILYDAAPTSVAVDLEAGTDEVLEPWPGGPLDIGEAVAQELSLALDPYPRAPGAALPPEGAASDAVAKKVNPFAELQKLGRRLT